MKAYKKIDFIQLYICGLLILTSATIFGSYIYYKQFLVVLFISAIIINKTKPINRSGLTTFLILSVILLFNYFTWQSNADGYIGLIIKIFSIILLANNIDKQKFMKYYVYFFSIYIYISLINYSILLNNWDKVTQIPIRLVWGSEMRPTLFYTFPAKEFYRNFGLYKEGGMYAIFLNLALYYSFNIRSNKWISFTRVMLIITIATTLSTTGILGAFIIIVGYSFSGKTEMIKKFFMAIVLLSILFLIESNSGIIKNKFTANNESFKERSSEISITMNILEDHLLLGTGYQNANAVKKYTNITMTNGILSIFIQFGLIFGTIILFVILINIIKINIERESKFILPIIFILFAASQPVMFQPIFILMFFLKD